MTETIFNPTISDFIPNINLYNINPREINTIEGLPRSGRGYQVTDIKNKIGEDPVIEVEMNLDAFRAAIGYLNRSPFSDPYWMGPSLIHKKKKPIIEKVIYNPPATIVWFNDGDKIVSKTEDEFDWETGLAICVLKKRMDRKEYNRLQPYFFEGDRPLWDVLVRMKCPNGEWEKIKKEWKR